MRKSRKAFTMIELVFVIVVVGILAGIAIPKFAATRDDAIIAKARTTVEALRAAIATEKQKRILRGDFSDINGSTAEGLLEYGFDGTYWNRSEDTFTFTLHSKTCQFKIENNKLVKQDGCAVEGLNDL